MNCIGATMTLNGFPYSITELLLLLLLRQLPIASVARLLWSDIAEIFQLLWRRRDRCVRHYIVITEAAV